MSPELSSATSLGDFIWERTFRYAQNTACIEADRDSEKVRYAYHEFRQAAMALSTSLQYLGLFANKRVALCMSNQSKWLLAATAVFWGGGVLVPIDYKLTPEEQLSLLKHSNASFLITEGSIWARWTKEGVALPSGVYPIVSELPRATHLNGSTYEDLLQSEIPSSFLPARRRREDIACIVYSSGTSGRPKGCLLTHGNYLAQAQSLARLFPVEPSDRYFSILPTNHAIDFMCGYLLPLHFGSCVIHQRTLRPEYLTWTMQHYGVTHMALVPMLLKALEQRIREKIDGLPPVRRRLLRGFVRLNAWMTQSKPNHPVSSTLLSPIHRNFGGRLRLLFSGGAFVDARTAEFFGQLGIPVVIGYGLTEAGTVLSVNTLDDLRVDTVGRPLPGTKIEIRNPNALGVGEVWVQGPTVMQGYLQDEELTRDTLVDGWLRTGDLGAIDPQGHLKLMGRTKNMIVTAGGKNVYPEDVEATFDHLAGLEEHCVFSSNYVWQDLALDQEQLVLVAKAKSDQDRNSLLHAIQETNHRLADYKRVGRILFVDETFPRTASMKVKRELLAKQLHRYSPKDMLEVQS